MHIITLPTYCCIQQLRYLSACPHAALNVERSSTHVTDRHFSCVIYQVTDKNFSRVIFQVKGISNAWFFSGHRQTFLLRDFSGQRNFSCVIFSGKRQTFLLRDFSGQRNFSCVIFQVTDRHFSWWFFRSRTDISHAWFFRSQKFRMRDFFQVTDISPTWFSSSDKSFTCIIFHVRDRYFSCVTLVEFTEFEDGTDRLSRNDGKELPPYTV